MFKSHTHTHTQHVHTLNSRTTVQTVHTAHSESIQSDIVSDIVSRTCVAQCQSELECETVHFGLLCGTNTIKNDQFNGKNIHKSSQRSTEKTLLTYN